jgi:hypothetical protein
MVSAAVRLAAAVWLAAQCAQQLLASIAAVIDAAVPNSNVMLQQFLSRAQSTAAAGVSSSALSSAVQLQLLAVMSAVTPAAVISRALSSAVQLQLLMLIQR